LTIGDPTRVRRLLTSAVAVVTITPAIAGAIARPLPAAPGCPLFPARFAINQRVDRLPVARDSAAIVRSIGRADPLHADFGSGRYAGHRIGIPFDVVSRTTRRSRVRFDYAAESDRVRYPIPRHVHVEGGSDRHALLVDRSACRLYELYALRRTARGWHAGSGATWDLRSTHLRPRGWTSADAAGLPILPLLARHDEVRRGHIDHALRVTVQRTRDAYVFPARHAASRLRDPNLPRMGERLRLKGSVRISGYPRQARVVLRALREYGLIVADNGSNWFVSGTPDAGWDDDQLHALGRITGRDFEVVDASSLR
jgi:hypothetical protein